MKRKLLPLRSGGAITGTGLGFSRPSGTDNPYARLPALKRRAIVRPSRWNEGKHAFTGIANVIFRISRIDWTPVFGFHLRLQL